MKISEKITKAKDDLRRLTRKGFFHIFGASTINKIIGFASAWIIIRIVTKAEYGVYSYANNIYSFFLLASGLGIASAILQICSEAETEEDKKRFYSYGLRFGIFINILLGILILIAGIFIL